MEGKKFWELLTSLWQQHPITLVFTRLTKTCAVIRHRHVFEVIQEEQLCSFNEYISVRY
jgi:hypothetical protein